MWPSLHRCTRYLAIPVFVSSLQALIASTKEFFALQLGVDPSLIDVILVEEGAQRRVLLRDLFQSPRRVNLSVAIAVPDSEVADVASRQLLETQATDISSFMGEKGVDVGSVSKGEVTIVNITLSPPPKEAETPSAAVEDDGVAEEKGSGALIVAAIGGAAGSAVLGGLVVLVVVLRKRRKSQNVSDLQTAQVNG